MEHRRLKPYHGLLLMGVTLVALVFIATPLQLNFGIYGLALTELMLVVLTAAAFFITKPKFKETFPMRLPPIREFFGGAFLYGGTYLIMIGPLLLTQYFFPDFGQTADAISDLGTSVSPALSVFIIAIMPAICEEILNRGYILSSLKSIKSTFWIVLINGALFGVFHLDPYRFLPTMMLGCVFAYIALKTESMVLTMIFHFINNLMSVISMFAVGKQVESYTEVYTELKLPSVLGIALVYLAIGGVMLFIGYCLINRRSPKTKTIAVVVITAIILAVAGIVMLASSSVAKVMDLSGTFDINPKTGMMEFPFENDSDGYYTVAVSALANGADVVFTLERAIPQSGEAEEVAQPESEPAETGDGQGITEETTAPTKREPSNIVLSQRGEGTLIVSQVIVLEKGDYVMRFKLEPEREGVYPQLTLQMQILKMFG